MLAGYSGAPFSNRAFNLRLRSACRALGWGKLTALACAIPRPPPARRSGLLVGSSQLQLRVSVNYACLKISVSFREDLDAVTGPNVMQAQRCSR